MLIWHANCGQRRVAAMPGDMDVDELQHALGAIILEPACLERVLRAAFSALAGSKHTAVIDGRWPASALIEDWEQIVEHHTGIAELAKEKLAAAFKGCREANRQRNRVIHDAWATRPGDVMVTLQGGRRSHEVTVRARTPAEVRRIADQRAAAADELKAAMAAALGPGWVLVEDELRRDLGRDISVDPGS